LPENSLSPQQVGGITRVFSALKNHRVFGALKIKSIFMASPTGNFSLSKLVQITAASCGVFDPTFEINLETT